MSTERDETETQQLVSAAYRELDTKKAPEHLNQAILQRAVAESAPGRNAGFRFTTWTKPLAWTAVIVLSLALILELSELNTVATPNLQPGEIAPPTGTAAQIEETQTEETAPVRSFGKARPAVQTEAGEQAESIAKPMSKKAAATGCDATRRESREDWMGCIQALRDAGATAQADLEYEAFLLEYPTAD